MKYMISHSTLSIHHAPAEMLIRSVIGPAQSRGNAVGSTIQRQKLAYGGLVQQEISTRTKESLGLNAPGGYRLGGAASRAPPTSPNLLADNSRRTLTHTGPPSFPADASTFTASTELDWACQVCTLYAYIPSFSSPLPCIRFLSFRPSLAYPDIWIFTDRRSQNQCTRTPRMLRMRYAARRIGLDG